MRRKAFTFIAPAQVVPEAVVGVVVATNEPVSVDVGTRTLSTQVIAGHLRVLGMELVPATARRSMWRKRISGGSQ